MINLDDLKHDLKNLNKLNPKNPGSWPWVVKIIVFVFLFMLVVIIGALMDWQVQWDDLQKIQQDEKNLKEVFLTKKKEAINLDLIKKQLTETQESFGALLKQLPSKSEMDALLTDISQAGLGRGLQFELFRPGSEITRDNTFVEQPITIRVTGNYDDIGKFSSDIAMLSRIVTLNDVSIEPLGGTAGGLSMNTTAKTFRYLDEGEAASLNKAAAKPAEAPKPAAGAKK